jgi:hypothetical protein
MSIGTIILIILIIALLGGFSGIGGGPFYGTGYYGGGGLGLVIVILLILLLLGKLYARRARCFRPSSWPGLSRPSTSYSPRQPKTWMPGTGPGMTTV